MSGNAPTVRDRVLSLFEFTRKAKGAPYEPERFQAFLTEPPRDPKTTWHRGRFVRFMYSVEQEFGFCFTKEEWDRTFSLDEFLSRIEKKLANPKQAHRFALRRFEEVRRSHLGQLILQIFFGTGILGVAVTSVGMTSVRFLLAALWLVLVTIFIYGWFKEYGHLKRIANRPFEAIG